MKHKSRTHYDNLHIAQHASPEVVRAAYKSLSQKWHPDKNLENIESAERISKLINRAYLVLSDPTLRKEHDLWISQQNQESSPDEDSEQFSETTTQSASQHGSDTNFDQRQAYERDRLSEIDEQLLDLDHQTNEIYEKRRSLNTRKIRIIGAILFSGAMVAFWIYAIPPANSDSVAMLLAAAASGLLGFIVAPRFSPSHRRLEFAESSIAGKKEKLRLTKMSLAKAYWLHLVFGGIVSSQLALILILPLESKFNKVQIYTIIFFLYYRTWASIQTWNAATRYTGLKVLAAAAKVVVILSAVSLVLAAISLNAMRF